MQDDGGGQVRWWGAKAHPTLSWLHGYTVLTRNLRHFSLLGVSALDPIEALPPNVG